MHNAGMRIAFLRRLLAGLSIILCAPFAKAQDKVTMVNGDVVTGQLGTMADGKLTIKSPLLGDVTVALDQVATIATQENVSILTKDGELLKRRITGIDAGNLLLSGGGEGDPAAPSVSLASLDKLNPPADPPPQWTGSLAVNGTLSTGNTERRAIGLALDAVRRSDIDRFTVDAAWDYAEDKQMGSWTLNQRRVGGGLKYDYFLSKRLYVLATARALGDSLADINLRFTSGVGLGYQWIETDTMGFSTEAGLSYFNENYRSATPSVDYIAARLAYKLTWALSDTTRLIHGVEAFPSLEDANDVYLAKDTRLQMDLTKAMFAQFQWVWDYDNTPSPGRDRSDHRFLVSVGWKF